MLKNEDFEKICRLARLKIEDGQKESFLNKMNAVFNWIEELSQIDVSGVDINNLKDMDDTPERKDIPAVTNSIDELMSNTKHKKFNMYCVPKIIE